MKNNILRGVWLIVVLASRVFAAPWELIASWPTPGPNPKGSVYAGGIYIVEGVTTPYVYSLEWNGSIHSSFPAPGGPGAWGLAYYNQRFYLSNNQTSYIYYMTTVGSVISSFLSPIASPAGLSYTADYSLAGTYLFVAIPDQNYIAVLNSTTGSLMKTYPAPGLHPTACGGIYYGSNFYVTDDYTHSVYLGSTPVITGIQTPVGFSFWANTNDEIKWVYVVDDATDYIYQYYTAEYYNDAEPASLGRIKALFR